jgi:hypothetical protein
MFGEQEEIMKSKNFLSLFRLRYVRKIPPRRRFNSCLPHSPSTLELIETHKNSHSFSFYLFSFRLQWPFSISRWIKREKIVFYFCVQLTFALFTGSQLEVTLDCSLKLPSNVSVISCLCCWEFICIPIFWCLCSTRELNAWKYLEIKKRNFVIFWIKERFCVGWKY